MSDWKFELGEIVVIDPLGNGRGPEGKVFGRTEYIDGSKSYHVMTLDFANSGLVRHQFAQHELSHKEQTDEAR